jgi:hypothetical protein
VDALFGEFGAVDESKKQSGEQLGFRPEKSRIFFEQGGSFIVQAYDDGLKRKEMGQLERRHYAFLEKLSEEWDLNIKDWYE